MDKKQIFDYISKFASDVEYDVVDGIGCSDDEGMVVLADNTSEFDFTDISVIYMKHDGVLLFKGRYDPNDDYDAMSAKGWDDESIEDEIARIERRLNDFVDKLNRSIA